MTDDQIIITLRGMMAESSQDPVDWAKVNRDSVLDSLGFDSLSILDLIYDVQQKFELEFDAEDMAFVKTLGELVDFIQARID